ncbi:MAG: acetate--CoA ligase family protein [Candidatus Thermoplasmatota archaeon]|nr:acetate--CoA ligase family protein [Candidatus Thermoplasmatota archaeon]
MKPAIKKILTKKDGLAENDVKDLLKLYQIPTTNYVIIHHVRDLTNLTLMFPVALKVCSPKILHKTDVGGVILNIQNKEQLIQHVQKFQKKFPNETFLVDEMVPTAAEIIVGLIQDPTFGLSIMCGIGGIFTELYKDVSFRVIPIDTYDASQMIEELKGKKLLEGFRNFTAQKQPVIDLLLRVSSMGEELMDYLDQMDLNPVFVYKDRCCVVDAKIVVKP